MWQDIVLAIGSILFTLAMLPTLSNKKGAVAWSSSLLTAGVLTMYLVVYATLGLWFAFVAGATTAVTWWLIFAFRRIQPTRCPSGASGLQCDLEEGHKGQHEGHMHTEGDVHGEDCPWWEK